MGRAVPVVHRGRVTCSSPLAVERFPTVLPCVLRRGTARACGPGWCRCRQRQPDRLATVGRVASVPGGGLEPPRVAPSGFESLASAIPPPRRGLGGIVMAGATDRPPAATGAREDQHAALAAPVPARGVTRRDCRGRARGARLVRRQPGHDARSAILLQSLPCDRCGALRPVRARRQTQCACSIAPWTTTAGSTRASRGRRAAAVAPLPVPVD